MTKRSKPVQTLNDKRLKLLRRQRVTLNKLANDWLLLASMGQPIQERYFNEIRAVQVTGRAIEKQLMEDK